MRYGERVAIAEFGGEWLDELLLMWRASFEAGVGVRDPHPLCEQREYFLSKVLPRNAVRLAVIDSALVGFVAASPESIAQLYVRVGFQRAGIGSRLLQWAKTQSSGSLWLFTFERNAGARAFYERNGFAPIARGYEPMWQLSDVKYQWTASAQNAA